MTSFGAVPPTGPTPGASFQADADLRWPGLLGGLSIAFGIITLLGTCCGSGSLAAMPFILGSAGMETPPMPGSILAWIVFDAGVSLTLGFMLFMGGLGLIRRRAGGPRMLLRYAVVRLALAVPMLAIAIALVPASTTWSAGFLESQMKAQEESGQPVTEEQEAALAEARTPNPLSYASAVVSPLIGCAYPIILLVWLRRPQVRATWESWEG